MNKPIKPPAQLALLLDELAAYDRVAGLTLIPLHRYDATSNKGGRVRSDAKRPLHNDWPNRPYPNAAKTLKECIEAVRNIGVRLSSSWLVIDVDPRNRGDEGFTNLCLDLGLDPEGWPCVVTGSGGRHYYLRVPLGFAGKIMDTLEAYPGVEFKSGNGRQVVAAGSIHPDRLKRYEWLIGSPALADAPEIPPRLLAYITRPARDYQAEGGGQCTSEQIAKALEALDVTDFRDHDKWLPLMMAVHHASGGDARQEWIDWSTSDPLYAHDDDRIGRRWDSLHTDKADGITYRTLNKILRDHGAVNAQVPNDVPDDEFGKFQAEDLKRLEEAEAAMPIAKLAHVNADNIDSLFKVVNLNGKMRVLWWARSALDRNVRTPQFWSTQEFKIALQNKTVTVKTKKTDKNGAEKEAEEVLPLAQWWLTLRSRFTWDGVVLQTELESSADSVNLWRGFGVAENTKGSWKLLRQHVREVIANGDEASDAYIIKWIAWALQHPCDPAEVALILKSSTHGTGKGHSAASAPEALRRSRDASIQDGTLDRPLQRAHLAMTCLLFVDEMTIGDNKETATLNSTLTEDSIAIEPKGVDAYMMPNHVKICGASNQEHVVWVADTDRRFAAFDVSDKRRGDTAYFNAIVEELEAGGYGAMLHDLLGLDLGTWHPRDNIPHTREKISEKVKSAPPELQWLAGYLDSGVLNCQVPNRGGMVIYADPFYEHARRTVAPLRSWTDNAFAAFLKDWGVTRKRSGTSQWVFPLLVEMRAAWRKRRPWWPEFDQTVTEWGDADAEDADDMDFG